MSVAGVPSEEVYCIAGDDKDNLWLSGNKGLSHMRDGHLVENFPLVGHGASQQAKIVASDRRRSVACLLDRRRRVVFQGW